MDNSSQATTGALSTGFLLWGSLPLSLLLLPASPVPTLPAWVTDAGEPLVLLPLSGQAAALRPPRVPNFPSPSGPGALEGTGTRQGLGVEPPSQAQVLIPLCRHSLKLSKARPGLRPVSVGSSDTNTTSPAVTHTAHSAPRTLQKHHPSSLAPLPVLPNGPRSRSAIFLGSTLMRSGTHRGTWSCPPLQPLLSSPLQDPRAPDEDRQQHSSTLLNAAHRRPPSSTPCCHWRRAGWEPGSLAASSSARRQHRGPTQMVGAHRASAWASHRTPVRQLPALPAKTNTT